MFSTVIFLVTFSVTGGLPIEAFNAVDPMIAKNHLPEQLFLGAADDPQEPIHLGYADARKFALQHKVDLIVSKKGTKGQDPLYRQSLEDQCAFCVIEEGDPIYNRVVGDSIRLSYRDGNLYFPVQKVTIGQSPFEEIYYQSPRRQVQCRNCR